MGKVSFIGYQKASGYLSGVANYICIEQISTIH